MGRAVTGYGRTWIAAAGAACASACRLQRRRSRPHTVGVRGVELNEYDEYDGHADRVHDVEKQPERHGDGDHPRSRQGAHPEGAKAFAAFYIASVSESGFTANASTLRAVSAPTCKGCQVFIEFAEELRAADQHVDRKSMRLNGMAVRPDSTADLVIVDCLVEDQPSRIVDSRGGVVSNEPGEPCASHIGQVARTRWIVAESLLVEGK